MKNALQRDGQDPSIMDLDQNRYVVHLMLCGQVIFVNRTRPKVQHDTSATLRFLTYFHPHVSFINRRPIQIQLDERNKYREFEMSEWM